MAASRGVQLRSALPPKADIAGRQLDVRFVSFPDNMQRRRTASSFD
jgi:hypothetical protein